jgi:mono/diheme cytochrome c family protein
MTISFSRLTKLFSIIALVLLTTGLSSVQAQEGGKAEPTGIAYRGRKQFVQRCVQCHGEEGRGDGPLAEQISGNIPDFTAPDYAATMSPQTIFDIITQGRMEKMMPSWENMMSESERWDVTAYVWSLHLTQARIDAAIQLYEANCTQCHGSSGLAVQEDTPNLDDEKWLALPESDLIAAMTNASHPDVGLDKAELALAAVAARRFSLGFDQAQVSVEGLGDIEVTVRNGTTGEVLANQAVSLIIFEQEQYTEMRNAQADEQGVAVFSGLPMPPTWAYVAETSYQGLTYHSEVGHFSPDSSKIVLDVAVYDAGASLDAIAISRSHWLVDIPNANYIGMGEVYSFVNDSNQVYAGEANPAQEKPHILKLPLPEKAIHIGVEGETIGERFLLEGTTLIDTQPLPPGETQIFIRYTLPVEEGQVALAHPILYPTAMLNLLIPDVGIQVDAPEWQQDESIPTQDVTFLNYSIFDLPTHAMPEATISGISEAVLAQGNDSDEPQQIVDHNAAPGISGVPQLPWIVSGLSVLLLGGGVLLGWRQHKQTQAQRPARREAGKRALVAQMASLDNAFERGDMGADNYHRQRNQLKLQLMALLQEEAAPEHDVNADKTVKLQIEEDSEHGEAID